MAVLPVPRNRNASKLHDFKYFFLSERTRMKSKFHTHNIEKWKIYSHLTKKIFSHINSLVFVIHRSVEIIGFSTNGEGKNRILNPKGKNSCPSGEATRARNFSLRGQEFYSCPSHWLRILFLRISNSLETISKTITFSFNFELHSIFP